MNKRLTILLIFFLLLITGIVVYYFYFFKKEDITVSQPITTNQEEEKSIHSSCLTENEWAVTNFNEHFFKRPDFREYPVKIVIMPKDSTFTAPSVFEFSVEGIDARNEGSPRKGIESRKCGLYIQRHFNYDLEWLRPSVNEPPYPNTPPVIKIIPGFKSEIWKYDYSGNGNPLLIVNEMDEKGVFHSNFTGEFAVDQTETYIALIRSWVGDPEHALVIKNLKTMEDEYIITLKDLMERFPDVGGAISLGWWGRDEFISFSLISPERPFFRFYLNSGKFEIFR